MTGKKEHRVGVHEAKTHLSRLIREVENGGEVLIVRGDKPVARIVRANEAPAPAASYGMFAGRFVMTDAFEHGSEELGDLFGIARVDE